MLSRQAKIFSFYTENNKPLHFYVSNPLLSVVCFRSHKSVDMSHELNIVERYKSSEEFLLPETRVLNKREFFFFFFKSLNRFTKVWDANTDLWFCSNVINCWKVLQTLGNSVKRQRQIDIVSVVGVFLILRYYLHKTVP